jgi:hypothetical protein
MGVVLNVQVEASSAFVHRLASLLNQAMKNDNGAIPDGDSATWYEHLVSTDVGGEVNTEAFVMVIAPASRFDEGREKWNAISESVRNLLDEGDGVSSLKHGESRTLLTSRPNLEPN